MIIRDCEINEDLTCVWCKRPADLRTLRRNCPASRGLGDTIAKFTEAIGIKPCGGCKERQAKLNEIVPYK